MDHGAPTKYGPYCAIRPLESTALWTEHLATFETGSGKKETVRLWIPEPGTVGDTVHALERISPLLGLRHDHLERLLDVNTASDELYLVTEHFVGRTVEQLSKAHFATRGPLPLEVSLQIARATLEALVATGSIAESEELFHGWLNDRALLLTVEGDIKLRHYGFASSCGWRPAFLVTTLGHSSDEVGAAAETQAVAQMLHGLIFPGGISTTPARSQLPAALARVLARALSPSEALRYPDPSALLEDLRNIRTTSWEMSGAEVITELLRELFGEKLEAEVKEKAKLTFDNRGSAPPPSPLPPRETTPPPGAVIEGRYRLLRRLGQGAAGVVFEAEHLELGSRVAIKMLDRDYSRDSYRVERFRREARAASRIGHPNIIRVTDLGRTEDDRFYYVMDLVEGVDLGSLIRSEGRLSQRRAVDVMLQICDALEAAHRKNVIHRDLKPENVVLNQRDSGEVAQIVDFGLSLTLDSREKRLTREGQAVGTPYYMAPEQVRGDPSDNRTDIYAAGVLFYEMLTGEPLFDFETVAETLTAHLHDLPIPPREQAPDAEISVALEEVILKALEKAPADRFQSMDELAHAINGAVAQAEAAGDLPEASTERAPVAPPREIVREEPDEVEIPVASRPRSRAPVIFAAAAASVVLFLAALIYGPSLLQGSSPETPRPPEAVSGDAAVATITPSSSIPTPALDAAQAPEGDRDGATSVGDARLLGPHPARDADRQATPALPRDARPVQNTTAVQRPAAVNAGARQTSAEVDAAPQGPAPSAQVAEADALLRQGQTARAMELYRGALAGAPGLASAWAGLGRASFEQGAHDQAATHLRRAVRLRPASVRYRLLLAGALTRAGQSTEARREYEEVLRLDPSNSVARRMLERSSDDR